VITLLGVMLIARPLLFATLDPEVAAARGVPVRLLSYVYLALLALAVAQAIQVVGALLIFALLVAPAAAAQRLTARPGLGLALTTAIALLVTWLGLTVAYFTPYPVGFFITSFAFAAYLLARLAQIFARRILVHGETDPGSAHGQPMAEMIREAHS
jgi:zinc/manganese transport system permease protein